MRRGTWIVLVAVAVVAVGAAPVAAQPGPRAELQLEDGEAYAGMPFTLSMVAEGFDEDPAPAQPTLTIPGIRVSALGGTPNTMGINIIDADGNSFIPRIPVGFTTFALGQSLYEAYQAGHAPVMSLNIDAIVDLKGVVAQDLQSPVPAF